MGRSHLSALSLVSALVSNSEKNLSESVNSQFMIPVPRAPLAFGLPIFSVIQNISWTQTTEKKISPVTIYFFQAGTRGENENKPRALFSFSSGWSWDTVDGLPRIKRENRHWGELPSVKCPLLFFRAFSCLVFFPSLVRHWCTTTTGAQFVFLTSVTLSKLRWIQFNDQFTRLSICRSVNSVCRFFQISRLSFSVFLTFPYSLWPSQPYFIFLSEIWVTQGNVLY